MATAIWLALAFLTPASRCQIPSTFFRHLSLDAGAERVEVRAILQDQRGFVWLAGTDGVRCYDGQVLSHHPTPGDITSEPRRTGVTALLEQRDGTLWAAGESGLHRFDCATTAFVRVPLEVDATEAGAPTCLAEGAEGVLWIGTTRGLVRLDPVAGVAERFDVAAAAGSDPIGVRSLLIADGRLWLASADGDVRTYAPRAGRFTTVKPAESGSATVGPLAVAAGGVVWTADEMRLVGLATDGSPAREVDLPAEVRETGPATALLVDRHDRIWRGAPSGLARFDPDGATWIVFSPDPDDHGACAVTSVHALFEDRTGMVWIGGVNEVDRVDARHESFVTYRTPDGTQVTAILEGDEGALWVGFREGGLRRYRRDAAAFDVITRTDGRALGPIHALHSDGRGGVLVGTADEGVALVKAGALQAELLDVVDAHGVVSVRALTSTVSGLWVGSSRGLGRLDGATQRFEVAGIATDFAVATGALVTDLAGRIWVGGETEGVLRWDPATGRTHGFRHRAADPASLSDDRVVGLALGAGGAVWAATRGGLDRLSAHGTAVDRFGSDLGPSAVDLCGVAADERGFLWLTTSSGLVRFEPMTRSRHAFGGWLADHCGRFVKGAAVRAPSGRLYCGADRGFVGLEPDRAGVDPAPPMATSVWSDPSERLDLRRPWPQRSRVEIEASDRSVVFEFALLDYVDPLRERCSYRLDGRDETWQDAGARRHAVYASLAPGTYTFLLRAAGADEVWGGVAESIEVVVTPRFWQTLSFKLALGAGLAVLLLLAHALRLGAVRGDNRRLLREMSRRTQELEVRGDQVERVNALMHSVNLEIDFEKLLVAVLEHTSAIVGTSRSRALVFDDATNAFRHRAALHWPFDVLESARVTPDEIDEILANDAMQLGENVWISIPFALSPRAKTPVAQVVLRIQVEGETEGYLLFDDMDGHLCFGHDQAEQLAGLADPIAAAFIKTRLLEVLRDRDRRKTELIGTAAHDIRNPLSILQASLQLMARSRDGRDGIARHGDLERATKAALRMRELLDRLLDLSAIESGAACLEKTVVDMRPMIRESVEAWRANAKEKAIDLTVVLPREAVAVEIDAPRVGQVVDNLVSNALKYTESGGHVHVTLLARGRTVILEVRDTGQGLSDEDMQQLFTTFARLSSRPTGGESSTGLGLAITKKIVDLHDGRIWVESRKGEGATFRVVFPAAEAGARGASRSAATL